MRRRCGCLVVAAILLGVGLWAGYRYASGLVERRIEREVAARIPSVIGAQGEYKVTAAAGLAGAAGGRIESVRIEGRDVRLKSGIKLKQLDATLSGIRMDRAKRAITKIEKAEFTASITGDELNAFLSRKYPDIPSRAVLHDGYVTVTARPRVRGVRMRVEADAAMEIEDGTRLVLRVRKVASGGLAAPDIARRYIEQRLNPVLDLSSLGFKSHLTSVTIRPDAVTLSGTGDGANLGL